MCQLPLISMWVVRMRSPEKCMSSHLPRDSTCSTVRPATGLWSFTLANGAYAVSNRLMVWPASPWCRARAERKMVSPSGIRSSNGEQCAPVIEALRRQVETGILKEGSEKMLRGRLTVDGRDQHATSLIFAAFHILLRQSGEKLAQVAGGD